MTAWDDLTEELDLWRVAGRVATFWWRDDDAVAPSEALDGLADLSKRHAADLALAVIPESCEEALVPTLKDHAQTSRARIEVIQHGIAHQNLAAANEKKMELTAAGSAEPTIARLRAGRERLASLFGSLFVPVLVPPWNRIAPDLIPHLPDCGFIGLSTYKIRSERQPAPGLLQINTHADLMRWRPERGFMGESEVLTLLKTHLVARRKAFIDPQNPLSVGDEPTGILTHHLVHDDETWRFLDNLLGTLKRHPATKLLAPSEAFFHAEARDGT